MVNAALSSISEKNAERFKYLRVVFLLVKRDLKVKYRGSFLGYMWSMLNPLLFMLIISFVFSKFMKDIPNYSLYVLSGILFWNMANLALIGGTHSIAANAHLIRKIKLPIWVFPCVPLGTAFMNFVLSLAPFCAVMLWTGHIPNWKIVFLPALLGLYAIFLLGVSLTLATLNVFFRDVGHVLEPLLQITFYATPIIYDRSHSSLPAEFKNILSLNPFTHFIEAARAILLGTLEQPIVVAGQLIFFAGLSLSIGTYCFKKAKSKFIFNL